MKRIEVQVDARADFFDRCQAEPLTQCAAIALRHSDDRIKSTQRRVFEGSHLCRLASPHALPESFGHRSVPFVDFRLDIVGEEHRRRIQLLGQQHRSVRKIHDNQIRAHSQFTKHGTAARR